MATLIFVQSTQSAIDNMPINFGKLYYATDTKKTYYDNVNNARVTLTNVIYKSNYSELTQLTITRPRNSLFVLTSTKEFYIFDHNNTWKKVTDSYEIPSYLMPSDELTPVTLIYNGESAAPRTLLKCVYNSNGESLEDLVNFKDASTTQRGVVLLYDGYDSQDTNTAPTSNALNKLYKLITTPDSGYKSPDADKLDGLDSTRFLQYGDTNNKAGYFDKSNTNPTGTTRLNYSGYFYATRVYNAVYNDYAELFEKNPNEQFEAGDVIVKDLESDKYTKSTKAYDKTVVGVLSNEFGHLLGGNGNEDDELNFIPIGMAGRVHVKVVGKVQIGDLLVSSDIPGVAMKSDQFIPGTIIGKCLESKNTDDIGMVRMLIMNS